MRASEVSFEGGLGDRSVDELLVGLREAEEYNGGAYRGVVRGFVRLCAAREGVGEGPARAARVSVAARRVRMHAERLVESVPRWDVRVTRRLGDVMGDLDRFLDDEVVSARG